MSSSNCRDEATRNSRGFTLIETLIATGIMLTALGAVAAMFAYSARTNLLNEQRTTATLLAISKMEDLRSTSSINDLVVGGSLTTTAANYFEYVSITSSGAIATSTTAGNNRYLRLWEISGTNPRLISIAVRANYSGVSGEQVELIRMATQLTNGF